jgi:SAM-dependent methyltransferase
MSNNNQNINYLIRGMGIAQMIGVICEAGLPDELDQVGATPVSSAAQKLNVNEDVLLRICRALVSFGFFSMDSDGNISHNEQSLLLRKDNVSSQHWAARFWTSPGIWQAWGALGHALKTGEEAFEHVHHQQFFSYMDAHEDEVKVYQQYMSRGYAGRHATVAANIPLESARLIVDVGGGKGTLLQEILKRSVDIAGIVYDQPGILADVSRTEERLSFIEGSFFDSVPGGGDLYILSWVLHDWPDQEVLNILRSCRLAMQPGTRLIIAERLISEDIAECDAFDLLLDIHMQVLHNGKERTLTEFFKLLDSSGFNEVKVVFKHAAFSIIEAVAC